MNGREYTTGGAETAEVTRSVDRNLILVVRAHQLAGQLRHVPRHPLLTLHRFQPRPHPEPTGDCVGFQPRLADRLPPVPLAQLGQPLVSDEDVDVGPARFMPLPRLDVLHLPELAGHALSEAVPAPDGTPVSPPLAVPLRRVERQDEVDPAAGVGFDPVPDPNEVLRPLPLPARAGMPP